MAGEAEQTEEVVVTVIDETLPDPEKNAEQLAKTGGDGGDADPVKDIGQQLEAMKRNAASERTRRLAAEETARTATREAAVVKTAAADAQYDSIVAGLDAAETEAKSVAREIKEALDAGDYEKAAQAQVRAGEVGYRVGRLKEAKADMDQRREAAPANERPAAPPPPTDPVEAFVAGRTEMTANWLRAHPEFILDPLKQKKLTAAHWDAEAEGLRPDTPEYFAHAEKFLGLTKEETVTDPEPKPEPKASPAAAKSAAKRAPAAPVNPTSNNGQIAQRNEVRLTQGEAAAAQDGTHVWGPHDLKAGRIKDASQVGQPIGIQEMARRKLLGQKDGLYDNFLLQQ